MKTGFHLLPLILLASTVAASAAGKHAPAPVLPPAPELLDEPAPPSLAWSGFYAGLNAGGAWANDGAVSLRSSPFFIAPDNPGPNPSGPADYAFAATLAATGSRSASSGGFIGGGQVGYNYRLGAWGGNIVVGLEADIQGIASSSGSGAYATRVLVPGQNVANDGVAGAFSFRRSVDHLGTARGRIGYLISPNLLAYGTGGFAYGGVNLSANGFQGLAPADANVVVSGPGAGSLSDTRVGWTAGGGVEWLVLPNWSVKAEYLYYDLGSARANLGVTGSVLSGAGAADGLKWATATQATARFDGHIARAGVNYHFNWASAPVTAAF